MNIEKTELKLFANLILGDGDNPCWIWIGPRSQDGYGRLQVDLIRGRAHRFAFEVFFGLIPEGVVICHACDVPLCCNPMHLWAGSHADNVRDCIDKGRNPRGENHYSRLHPEMMEKIRGKNHYMNKHPEKRFYGDKNGSRSHPELLKRGEDHGRSKLSNKQVLEISKRLCNGEVGAVLAKEFNVSKQTICNIKTGRKWSSVTGINKHNSLPLPFERD